MGVELARIDKETHANIDRWEASGADSVHVYAIRRDWMVYIESVKLKWAVGK